MADAALAQEDTAFLQALEQIKALVQGSMAEDVTTEDVSAAMPAPTSPPGRPAQPPTQLRTSMPAPPALRFENARNRLAGGPDPQQDVTTLTGARPADRDPIFLRNDALPPIDYSEGETSQPRSPRPSAYASSAGHPLGDYLAHLTGSNALGRTVSGLEDAAGAVLGGAYTMTGIPGVSVAADNMAAAEAAGDPVRFGAAVGQGALATLPYNRLAQAAFHTVPRALAAGGAMAGIPIAAGTAFLPADAEAQTRQPSPAPQPAAPTPAPSEPRQARIRELQSEIRNRERTLEGFATRRFESKYAREQASLPHTKAIDDARQEITRLTTAMENETSKAADAVRQAAEQERWANTPLGKAYPWAPPALATAGVTLGALGANAISRAGVRNYNTNIRDLSSRWQDAVETGSRARTATGRESSATLARGLGDEFEALESRGARGTLPAMMTAIGATELGMGAPMLIDYTTSSPGSPLRDYTMQSMSNPWELGSRIVGGGLAGGALAKIAGGLAQRNIAEPPTFRAETNALAGSGPSRLMPPSTPPSLPPPPLPPLAPPPTSSGQQLALPAPGVPPASSSSSAPTPPAPRSSSRRDSSTQAATAPGSSPPEGSIWNPQARRWMGPAVPGRPGRPFLSGNHPPPADE